MIEIICSCGQTLGGQSEFLQQKPHMIIKVEPCTVCLARLHDEGFEAGETSAEKRLQEEIKDARQAGYDEGYEAHQNEMKGEIL